jgi:cyclic-di-GMP phosphodiesterase TipF (flagellum assembly factor)
MPATAMQAAATDPAGGALTTDVSDADIAEAVAARRIETYLESIADVVDQRTRHFEISLWLRTAHGALLTPEVYAPRLHSAGIAQIDTLKLARIARIADRLKPRAPSALVFSTFGAQSLIDNAFLDTAAAMLAEQAGRQIVLSFTQADMRQFADPHWDTLATMAEAGMRFAIVGLTDLAMDFAGLKARGFDFARIDAATLLSGMRGKGGTATGADISEHLTNSGLGLMAHGIDDDERLARARELRLLYGQGAKFGGARPVTADLGPSQEAAA